MKKKKATNKQILDAYGQSYRLMQKAKQHDDVLEKTMKTNTCIHGYTGANPYCVCWESRAYGCDE